MVKNVPDTASFIDNILDKTGLWTKGDAELIREGTFYPLEAGLAQFVAMYFEQEGGLPEGRDFIEEAIKNPSKEKEKEIWEYVVQLVPYTHPAWLRVSEKDQWTGTYGIHPARWAHKGGIGAIKYIKGD